MHCTAVVCLAPVRVTKRMQQAQIGVVEKQMEVGCAHGSCQQAAAMQRAQHVADGRLHICCCTEAGVRDAAADVVCSKGQVPPDMR